MEDLNDKRKILLGIKNKILHMPNSIQKVNMIDSYIQLLGYYQESNNLTFEEFMEVGIEKEFTGRYERKVVELTSQKINELYEITPYIHNKFDEMIKEYKNNGFCSYEFELYRKVNAYKLYPLIDEFFASLGQDVQNLFHKIVVGENLALNNSSNYLGVSMNSLHIDNPCIVIRDIENYLTYYFTLAHEMGHCYQFYLQRNHQRIETFNPFTEVTSILFEKMFKYFLESKYKFPKELIDYELESNIYFLNDLAASKVLCELFMNNNITNIDAYNLSYQTNVPLFILQKRMRDDCGYIMGNKLDLNLTEFHYTFGEIISSYFMDKMDGDFEKTWKEYKNFICTVDNYPLKEVLDQYMDVNLMKNKIKVFIKSYHGR